MPLRTNKNDFSPLKVQEIITKLAAAALNVKTSKITAEESLFSTKKAFDSFAMLEIVLRLEEAFQMSIPDEDLDPDVFFSVNTIAAYICDKRGKGE